MATFALAAFDRTGAFAGFCLTMAPGADYESLNYQWFSSRYEEFTYLDRIVVSSASRNEGLGAALYAELELRIAGTPRWLLCEVNVKPLNEGSLRFHRRIGFTEVGQQDTEGGTKRVQQRLNPCRAITLCWTAKSPSSRVLTIKAPPRDPVSPESMDLDTPTLPTKPMA